MNVPVRHSLRSSRRVVLSQQFFLSGFITVVFAASASAQLPAPAPGASAPASTSRSTVDIVSPSGNANVPYLPPPSDDDVSVPSTPAPTTAPKIKPRSTAPKRASLTVGGVSVRGMTDVAAIKKLRSVHASKLTERVTLWDGKARHHWRRSSLGASIPYHRLLAEARARQNVGGNIPLRFDVNINTARRAMKTLSSKVNHAPANASLDVDENGQVILRGGEGAQLALEGSALRVKAALENEPPQNYIELVVTRQPGSSTLRQYKYLLAEYSTPYDAGIVGRTNNLKMAARNVNGTVVQNGAIFSTNKAIGPRNAAAGWKEAKMFVGGDVVNGVGAGICQCATTLYNAALLSNFPIVERHPHSFRVKYAPASRDATLYWGHKDMKFRNNSGGPIYVQTFLRNSRFYARIYGTKPVTANVAVESRIISNKNGTRSEAYRVVQNGTAVSRQKLSQDYYRPPKT